MKLPHLVCYHCRPPGKGILDEEVWDFHDIPPNPHGLTRETAAETAHLLFELRHQSPEKLSDQRMQALRYFMTPFVRQARYPHVVFTTLLHVAHFHFDSFFLMDMTETLAKLYLQDRVVGVPNAIRDASRELEKYIPIGANDPNYEKFMQVHGDLMAAIATSKEYIIGHPLQLVVQLCEIPVDALHPDQQHNAGVFLRYLQRSYKTAARLNNATGSALEQLPRFGGEIPEAGEQYFWVHQLEDLIRFLFEAVTQLQRRKFDLQLYLRYT
ncbi:hypothetical protein F4780DRAFT_757992 [Xylariomycetidae sp. FL0641]|nr:hypothetical protein F4780DRAFT_757992 [Xylariomycetidae sp. FL0641]